MAAPTRVQKRKDHRVTRAGAAAFLLLSMPSLSASVGATSSSNTLQSARLATVIYQVKSKRKVIALTFDAGADRGYGKAILKTLERARVRVTFGMTGLWASANRDLVRRMASDRDTFINHTYDHHPFTPSCASGTPAVLTSGARTAEIKRAEAIILSVARKSPKPYFRPPCGGLDTSTLELVRALGYRYVIMWSVDSLGWEGASVAAITSRCLSLATPGGIIAMHVGSQSLDALALKGVIRGLRKRGYSFVTIPQLLAGH